MADWWLVNYKTQIEIAQFIDSACFRVINHFNDHHTENNLTAALGQELMQRPLILNDTVVTFKYRNFGERKEESVTGADGGIIARIRTQTDYVEKGVLFQAKKLPEYHPVLDLSLTSKEAQRLKDQIDKMLRLSSESIVLAHTRQDIYALKAKTLQKADIKRLRNLFQIAKPTRFGTFLGMWVARCARGDLKTSIISRLELSEGFLREVIVSPSRGCF